MTRRVPCPPAPGPLEAYAARFDDLLSTLAQRRGFHGNDNAGDIHDLRLAVRGSDLNERRFGVERHRPGRGTFARHLGARLLSRK